MKIAAEFVIYLLPDFPCVFEILRGRHIPLESVAYLDRAAMLKAPGLRRSIKTKERKGRGQIYVQIVKKNHSASLASFSSFSFAAWAVDLKIQHYGVNTTT